MCRRRRHEVVDPQLPLRLQLQRAQHLIGHHARRPVERLAALPGEGERVHLQASNARGVERERDQPPEIVIVVAARDHGQERGRDAVPVEERQHAPLARQEVTAQERAVAGAVERIERQDDPRAEARQLDDQRLVGEEAQAVRRDRHPANPLLYAERDQAREVRVHGRLAAREVDDPALGRGRAQMAKQRFHLGGAHVPGTVVLVVGVADRTVEVAGAGDRHDRQRDILLVRGARAAVERAALAHRCRRRRVGRRQPGRLGDRPCVPIGVRGDRDLRRTVLGASLAHDDGAARAAHAHASDEAGTARLQTPHRLVVAQSSVKAMSVTTTAAEYSRGGEDDAVSLARRAHPRLGSRDDERGRRAGGERALGPRNHQPLSRLQERRPRAGVGDRRGRDLDAQTLRGARPARGAALRGRGLVRGDARRPRPAPIARAPSRERSRSAARSTAAPAPRTPRTSACRS